MAWIVVAWTRDESPQGFEAIITTFRIHGLDQLWIVWLWLGPGMRVPKVFRQLLHPPELMVWINCGLNGHENFHLQSIHLARCGFDQDMKAV